MGVGVLALAACGEVAKLPVSAGTGPQPTLPPPHQTLVPTVNVAPARLAWEPLSGGLWTVVNERGELGSDLVPDYMTSRCATVAFTAGPTATAANMSTNV